MIDYIHERCRSWGAQMRWVTMGQDGWPSRTILGKMIAEGSLGASAGRFVQHFPEVLAPDALEINNAIKTLRETHREILFVHYVVVGQGKSKARTIGIHIQTYYDRLDSSQGELARALYILSIRNSQNCMSDSPFESGMLHVG